MNKKITVIVVLLSFVILSCNSGIAINIKNNNNELSEEYISDVKTYVLPRIVLLTISYKL